MENQTFVSIKMFGCQRALNLNECVSVFLCSCVPETPTFLLTEVSDLWHRWCSLHFNVPSPVLFVHSVLQSAIFTFLLYIWNQYQSYEKKADHCALFFLFLTTQHTSVSSPSTCFLCCTPSSLGFLIADLFVCMRLSPWLHSAPPPWPDYCLVKNASF